MAKKELRDLSGKLVVITGGARGIGAATARALVAKGARVVIGDLDEQLTQQAAAQIGGGTVGYRLDVTDHAGFTKVLDQVEADLGPIYALINNAGIMPLAFLEDETRRDDVEAARHQPRGGHPRHPRGHQADEAAP